jgi:hypothetical protein
MGMCGRPQVAMNRQGAAETSHCHIYSRQVARCRVSNNGVSP